MTEYEDIVRFVFRAINLGIFISLVVYFFKKYLIKGILEEISKQKASKHNLDTQYAQLGLELETVGSEIAQQEDESRLFEEKIQIWHGVIAQEKKKNSEFEKKVVERIKSKVKKQQDYLLQKTVRRSVFPRAVSLAGEKLIIKFKDQNMQQKYLEETLSIMNKE